MVSNNEIMIAMKFLLQEAPTLLSTNWLKLMIVKALQLKMC